MRAFLHAIMALGLVTSSVAAATARPQTPLTEQRQRNHRPLILGLAALSVAILALVILARNGDDEPVSP